MQNLDVFSLKGQRALVTGSSAGLGLAMAQILAAAGAEVWVNGRSQDAVDATVAKIGGTARAAVFDVSDTTARSEVLTQMQDLGGVDILINNVGMRDRRSLEQFSGADIERLLSVNLAAPFELAQAAGMQMAAKEYGRIVNVSSIAGLIAQPGDALYTTAKAGLNGMTKALAAELGPKGVNVNGIAPGFFKTEPNAAAVNDLAVTEKLKAASALGRWGSPEELAPVVLLLASPAASYLTGQIIAVDGGYTAHY